MNRKLGLLGLFLILGLGLGSGCALNNADAPLGELRGGQTNDPDYHVNLWPTPVGEEPNPILMGQLSGWPQIEKNNTVLFIGDQSLQGNWGLALQKLLVEEQESAVSLSACNATAQSWKSGSQADCLYSAPFVKFKEGQLFLTQNLKQGTDRALPLILAHEKVSKVVLSFGAYLKDITSATALQEELVAIEILAKWTHSAGKTCYFVSPVGSYFLESGQVIVPAEILARLKVLLDPYCYWVDSVEARKTFLAETQIDLGGKVIEAKPEDETDTGAGYIRIDEAPAVELPKLPPLVLPDMSLDLSDIPDIIEDKESPIANRPKPTPGQTTSDTQTPATEVPSTQTPSDQEPQDKGTTPKTETPATPTPQEDTLDDSGKATVELPDGTSKQIPLPTPRPADLGQTEEPAKTGEQKLAEALEELGPENVPVPQERPQYLKEQDQQAIREQIENKTPSVAQAETRVLRFQEPKYLWNGYAQGSNFTRYGKIELKAYGKHLYQTKNLSDATMYCPNYWSLSEDDKRNVWLYLYSAMALYESTFNSNAKAVEVTGGTSMGLFQMDYNNCKQSASKPTDLLNPQINFRCAIRKSVYLVREGKQIANGSYPSNCNRQGCSYRGGAMDRFWSTFRKPYQARIRNNKGQLVNVTVGKRNQIINHMKSLPHCKK